MLPEAKDKLTVSNTKTAFFAACSAPAALKGEEEDKKQFLIEIAPFFKSKGGVFALIRHAEQSDDLKATFYQPELEGKWCESLELFGTIDLNQFTPVPQTAIHPFEQVLSYYYLSLAMQRIKNSENVPDQQAYPAEKYDEEVLRLLNLSAQSGSFAASIRLQYHYFYLCLHTDDLGERASLITKALENATTAAKLQATPGALLLAEAHYFTGTILRESNPESALQNHIEALKSVHNAKLLEPESASEIHNAYQGRSLTEAFANRIALADWSFPFNSWHEFIDGFIKLTFANHDKRTIEHLKSEIQSTLRQEKGSSVTREYLIPCSKPI